ncbi:hypothetical protein NO1_1291, partial [Candidatus Termititenax aidoneus]
MVRCAASSLASGKGAEIFSDNFDRANSQSEGSGVVLDSNSWTKKFFGSQRNWTGINNNATEIAAESASGRGGLYVRSAENINLIADKITVSYKIKFSATNAGLNSHLLVCGYNVNSSGNPQDNSGLDVYLQGGNSTVNFNLNGVNIFSQNNNIFTLSNTWYRVKIYSDKRNVKLKAWLDGSSEPLAWNIDFRASQEFPVFGYNYLGFGLVSTNTGSYWLILDDFKLQKNIEIVNILYQLPA